MTQTALNKINEIEEQFDKYTKYVCQIVKHYSQKGFYQELHLRLDFNKFYDK